MVFRQVKINRFKNLDNLTLDLDKINVIVGSNNSGKSSILHAIQFAVSLAQTTSLEKTARWDRTKGSLVTSISPTQLIYSPLRDIPSLAPNNQFFESPNLGITVQFFEEITENSTQIIVTKGRNKNIRVEISGINLGTQLQEIESPYCIYVPGLAGIQNIEDYKPPSHVRRAAARGDANHVFRNILLLLKEDGEAWDQFLKDFQFIFPNLSVQINYDRENEESINAFIKINSNLLPIDAAGTGVLQAIQIFSYINLYQPKVLLLDEPDAHLHPNNQRLLARILIHLVESRNLQVILCTHSRHILDALSSESKIHWIRNGKIVNEPIVNIVNVLMDLGALDEGDRLRQGSTKCVILTEDEIIEGVQKIFAASGFKMEETEIWSYKGCTNLDTALTLAAFIREHAPGTKIFVHKDRDFNTDSEITEFKTKLESLNISCFVTTGPDIESHFISAQHINLVYPAITQAKAEELIAESTIEKRDKLLAKFINSRYAAELKKRGEKPNPGEIATSATHAYDTYPTKYRHGKTIFGVVSSKIQRELGININLYQVSDVLKIRELEEIASTIWRPQ
jgi:energy-coupling factor transporter ATP-binding protein EcfA2